MAKQQSSKKSDAEVADMAGFYDPSSYTANAIYWVEAMMSFLVPPTCGLAVLSLPILAPLGDFSGIGRDLIGTASVILQIAIIVPAAMPDTKKHEHS
jgi:uncharacterized ion transporter superfamily protein YfcC